MAIDLSTNVGQVRALIPDLDETDLLFKDTELAAYLALAEGSTDRIKVLRAAALAVDVLARSEALLLKVLSVSGVGTTTTDGSKLAAELRQHATQLRAEADQGGDFEVAEVVTTPWAARQRVRNEGLRDLA